MPVDGTSCGPARLPLSRERVLCAAVEVADERGLGALTMRGLGETLGVEAMSLYNHVNGKDDLLDGMFEMVVAEIEVPSSEGRWKDAVRARAHSAREAFNRHPWMVGLMETRLNLGVAGYRYYDAIIGIFLEAGFSIGLAVHALSTIDSYIYGFVLQESRVPFDPGDELIEVSEEMLSQLPREEYPHLTRMIEEYMDHEGRGVDEFEFGLELILDGLERIS